MSVGMIIKYVRAFFESRVKDYSWGVCVVGSATLMLAGREWFKGHSSKHDMELVVMVGVLVFVAVLLMSEISLLIEFLLGGYPLKYFEIARKLQIGKIATIPNTQIEALMVRDKKDDFKIFDYDGGIIVSLIFPKREGQSRFVNLRFECEHYDSMFRPKPPFYKPVGSIKGLLGREWWSRYVVDLNDPDYKGKLRKKLEESENIINPDKK